MVSIDQFREIEIRTAKVLAAERVEGSDKLIKLHLNAGDKNEAGESVERQILAGVGKAYEPEELIGKTIVVVANLEPRTFTLPHGEGQVSMESNGMLLAASGEDGRPVVLAPEKEVPPGSRIS